VRLLFDENLSPRLVRLLADLYPGSSHVHDLGLGAVADAAVWAYAREQGFTVVSKDADFHVLSQLRGHPPKVVWVRRGNCSTADVAALLRSHQPRILEFGTEPDTAFLTLA
jgi:predicted nuclease of predicted toxin-antitoxin system